MWTRVNALQLLLYEITNQQEKNVCNRKIRTLYHIMYTEYHWLSLHVAYNIPCIIKNYFSVLQHKITNIFYGISNFARCNCLNKLTNYIQNRLALSYCFNIHANKKFNGIKLLITIDIIIIQMLYDDNNCNNLTIYG